MQGPDHKQRIVYWDIAKGIAILLCVIGHQPGIPNSCRSIIFSFHMPIFFIANAYFIKRYDIGNCLKRSARSLLVPYATVCLVSAVLNVLINPSGAERFQVFVQGLKDMLMGISWTSTILNQFQSVWLVWFVICLFAARLLYTALMAGLQKKPWWVGLLVMTAVTAAGVLIGTRVAYLPWSFDVAMASMIFMWTGDQLRRTSAMEKVHPGFIIYVCGLLWIGLVRNGYQIEFVPRSYPGYILCYFCAIAGSLTVVQLSKFLEKVPAVSAFLKWCGKNSMTVLAFHCLEMRFVPWERFLPGMIVQNWLGLGAVKLICILAAAAGPRFVTGRLHAAAGNR